MRRIRQQGTDAELVVRRLCRELGAHYRTQNRDLPGSPDLANRRRAWAIFVNGCFWHGHRHCRRLGRRVSHIPKTNARFWARKQADNRRRDAEKIRQLRGMGFRVRVIWECELTRLDVVRERIRGLVAHTEESSPKGVHAVSPADMPTGHLRPRARPVAGPTGSSHPPNAPPSP